MPLNGKRIFLAGASGMAGSAVLRLLLERFPGVCIRAIRFSSDHIPDSDSRVEWMQADLRDKEKCRSSVAGCDCAIMTSASTAGSLGMAREPWKAVDDNVIMNTQMLEAFHFEGVHRIVFVSSASVYQEFDGAIRENELDLNSDPHPAYAGIGWGMRFIEKLCHFWHIKTGMEILVARAANIFGPMAAFDPERSNVVPALIRKSVARMDPFEVLGSPDVIRDLIFTDDFAKAVICLLESADVKFDIFNVGAGQGTALSEIVQHALSASGHKPSSVEWVEKAPLTIRKRILNCDKFRELLGWKTSVPIEEGIRKTTQWWVENQDRWKK